MDRYIVSKEGMKKGSWKIYDTVLKSSREIITTKSVAIEQCKKWNAGYYDKWNR